MINLWTRGYSSQRSISIVDPHRLDCHHSPALEAFQGELYLRLYFVHHITINRGCVMSVHSQSLEECILPTRAFRVAYISGACRLLHVTVLQFRGQGPEWLESCTAGSTPSYYTWLTCKSRLTRKPRKSTKDLVVHGTPSVQSVTRLSRERCCSSRGCSDGGRREYKHNGSGLR
jgi:hypothetical protein